MKLREIKISKQIIYLLVLAIVLNILRIFLFKTTSSVYMFWNIFLAFIPFFISSILIVHTKREDITKPFFILGFIIWFLFLPNAPYVITDLIHLGKIRVVPVMYDAFFFFSSAAVSFLMGLHSLAQMEKMLLLRFPKKVINIIIPIIILLASFGIYLGRFLRFNSWDIFTSHLSVISTVWDIFTKSNNYINVYSYTVLFFFFVYMSFISFKSTNK